MSSALLQQLLFPGRFILVVAERLFLSRHTVRAGRGTIALNRRNQQGSQGTAQGHRATLQYLLFAPVALCTRDHNPPPLPWRLQHSWQRRFVLAHPTRGRFSHGSWACATMGEPVYGVLVRWRRASASGEPEGPAQSRPCDKAFVRPAYGTRLCPRRDTMRIFPPSDQSLINRPCGRTSPTPAALEI